MMTLEVNVYDSEGGLISMVSETDKVASRIEEVIDEASGKVYLPPCQVRCPLKIDIQRNHAMISCLPLDSEEASSQILKIGDEIYDKNPLFPIICGYICGLCEKECNYEDQTGAVRRKLLVRFIAEHYLPYLETKPSYSPPTKEKVAVIGGGPAGLMCAYTLSRKGYWATIVERSSELGGALRLIPRYRLPKNIIDTTLDSLVRIANIDVKLGFRMGDGEKTLDELKNEGYKAIFIATGTPAPRPLSFEREPVAGADLEGVMFGLDLLSDFNQKKVHPRLFEGKKVIVIGGGNVAFDVARTARRLGGDVTVVCLESEDKSSKDGIPADVEEIEGASEEGIKITYSRGVEEIIGEDGKFKKIKCPRCTWVYDQMGYIGFNPKFDRSDVIYLEGDVLLVTIGQAAERKFFQQEDLLDERGRIDVDQLTLMSNCKEGIFIGGDVRRVGYASEAMREGMVAAESIDRYLRGEDLKEGREREYEEAAIPRATNYKPQPELIWLPAEERLNFEPFEKGFTREEAVEEAVRCLYCGPCKSCKACVALELQFEIPEIELNREICSGCGVCVALCSYDAIKLEKSGDGAVAVINDPRCKRCGVCAAACPSAAITPEHFTNEEIMAEIEGLLV
jgi:NADPH-dependent glutamate synthase beta subunit-like oxidoreductase